MKKVLFISAVLLGGCLSLQAQNENERGTERKQLTQEERLDRQAKQLAERLMLDDKTTARFEKVYKEYQNELMSLSKKKSTKAAQTDEEIEAAMKENWNQMKKTAEIQEKYYGEFRKFLTIKQAQQVLGGAGRFGMPGRAQGMPGRGQGMSGRGQGMFNRGQGMPGRGQGMGMPGMAPRFMDRIQGGSRPDADQRAPRTDSQTQKGKKKNAGSLDNTGFKDA